MAADDPRLRPVGLNVTTALLSWSFAAMCMYVAYDGFSQLAPPANVRLWLWIVVSQLGFWALVNVALVIIRPRTEENTIFWIRLTYFLGLGLNADVLASIWLFMPYAPPEYRATCALFSVGYVATAVETGPENVWVNRIAIVSVMASLAIMVARHMGETGAYLLSFFAFFTVGMFLMNNAARGSIQGNRAARIAADAARLEVETQRDAKTRFLASASHDLGQPLQSARLFFDQAVRSGNPVHRAKAVMQAEAAFASIERQLHQMNDHLRLDSGEVVPHIGEVAVGMAIARIAALAEAKAVQAGVVIHAMPSRLRVRADADLLERALSNLVDNALRHAKAKRVLIGARRHGDRVRAWVIDDGAGISTVDLPRLFEDYVQGSDHGDEVRGGFGLGLASVRRIATLMGGSAGCDPRWMHGAAFYVELKAG